MKRSVKSRVVALLGAVVVVAAAVVWLWTPARVGAINLSVWWAVRLAEDRGVAWQRLADAWVPVGALLVAGDSLAGQMPPRLVEGRAVVFGVGGALIEDVAKAMRNRASLKRVAALVVIAGTNDLVHRVPEASERALLGLLEALPPGLPVLLCTVPPVDPVVHHDRSLAAIAAWNERLRSIAAGRPGVHIVDTQAALANDAGVLPEALHQGDGLHLSRAGYERLAAAIGRALAEAGVR